METARPIDTRNAAAPACCAAESKSGWASRRNLFIGLALAGGAGAMFFGWDWLVAAGLAGIILGVLPCLAMCALGLCANRLMGGKQKPAEQTPPTADR